VLLGARRAPRRRQPDGDGTDHENGIPTTSLPPWAGVTVGDYCKWLRSTYAMRIPSWLVIATAVLAAIPFGWGLGVLAAFLILGGDFGQLPALTVPVCIIASIIFVLSSSRSPWARLAIMVFGTGLFVFVGMLLG